MIELLDNANGSWDQATHDKNDQHLHDVLLDINSKQAMPSWPLSGFQNT